MAGSWRKYTFFDKDVLADNIQTALGARPTCCAAEGGALVFGDAAGCITIADRDFHISERRERAFNGAVSGVAYLFDPKNHAKQFIIAIGDDYQAPSGNCVIIIENFINF